MGLTRDVATALETKLAAISGIAGASGLGLDTVPDTPWAVIGSGRSSEVSAGGWETEIIDYPLLVLVGRVISVAESQGATYDWKDAVQDALRSAIQQGLGASGVTQALLVDWDTDNYLDVGGETYQALTATIRVTLARAKAGAWSA